MNSCELFCKGQQFVRQETNQGVAGVDQDIWRILIIMGGEKSMH